MARFKSSGQTGSQAGQYAALPLAELGEAGLADVETADADMHEAGQLLSASEETPPRKILSRMGSEMTGSELSLPGTRTKQQRRQEWLNSELLDAVLEGPVDKVSKLLEQGAEARAVCSPTRTSALQLCALWAGRRSDAVDVANLLIAHGADIRHRDHCDRTVFHLAAWAGAADLVEALFKHYQEDADSPCILNVQTRLERELDEREPFLAKWKDAWTHNHAAVSDKLPTLEEGSSALHVACARTHLRCIELFRAAGADLTVRDGRGLTPAEVLHEDPGRGEDDDRPQHVDTPEDTQKGTADGSQDEDDWVRMEDDKTANLSRTVLVQPANVILGGDKLGASPTAGDRDARRKQRLFRTCTTQVMDDSSAEERLLAAITCLKNAGGSFTPGAILHTAVMQGSLQAVSVLLDLDKEAVVVHNKEGETPVHTAINCRNMDALLLMLEKSEQAANVRSDKGHTPLMSAVFSQWDEAVSQLLLANADVTARDAEGATVLHAAAERSDTLLLKELLSMSEGRQVLEYQRDDGRTPLFVAVESSNTKGVQLFLEVGAKLTHTLDSGKNVLHRAVERQDEAMVTLLIERLASTADRAKVSFMLDTVPYFDTRLAPLHLAAKDGNGHIVRLLLNAGCNPCVRAPEDHHQTALHIAAQEGFSDVVKMLLSHRGSLLHEEDNRRWRPVHTAAHFAQRDVLRILIMRGADLSTEVRADKENRQCSALSLLVHSLANPVDFLEELLDSSITLNEYSVSDQRAVITVDYSILIPEGPERQTSRSHPQMRVIDAIVESGNYFGQQHLLQHPLIESFMTLKWKKMAPFFYAILVVHLLFVCTLTSLVAQIYWWAGDQGAGVQFARFGVFFTTVIIALQEILHLIQLRKMYVMDPESWLKWIAILLSLIVASVVFEGVEQQPVEGPRAGRPGDRWQRHVTTLAVLMAYTELLLLLCRFPRWGLRVLMFYKVAINVIKMLLTFSFLIVGFALSFFVQFRGEEPFPTLLESLGKTFVMGTSEFDYGDIFAGSNDTVVGRVLFFLFVLLVPVVLMNLLVGLAVSDIATLETKGRKRGLVKQAEFLSTLERLVHSQSVRWCMPSNMRERLPIYLPVDRVHKIFPGKSLSIIFEVFPDTIRNEIVTVAMRNASQKDSLKEDNYAAKTVAERRAFGFGTDTRLYDELAFLRREMMTRREMHDANERHERHFRSLHRQLESLRARLEDYLNTMQAYPTYPAHLSEQMC